MGFLFITAQQTEKLIVPDSIQKAKFAETVEKIANMDLEKVLTNLVSESIWVGLKIVLALAIYMAGRWLIGRLIKLLSTAFEKRKVDRSLQIFLRNLIKTISYIVLILLIIQVMGINTTSIVALLASAGLAIGMALSGTAQNFAGGVMILLMKPYRVGDFISAQGQSGTVREIKLFSTVITTGDNQTIYIPNNSIATAIIDNYSTSETRRVDWTIGISYGDDVDAARRALLDLLAADKTTAMRLNDNYMITPEEALCGLFFADAEYFSVGRIDREQLADYSARRDMDTETIEKLIPNNI